jgi:transcriptional regulator with XRE-family HTH domain
MARANIRTILARNIRKLREKNGYSQDVLADRAGLNRSYIGSIERAEHNVGVDNINKIAGAFDVTVSYLLNSDVDGQAEIAASDPPDEVIVQESRFQALLEQYSRDRNELKPIMAHLESCGVKFSA